MATLFYAFSLVYKLGFKRKCFSDFLKLKLVSYYLENSSVKIQSNCGCLNWIFWCFRKMKMTLLNRPPRGVKKEISILFFIIIHCHFWIVVDFSRGKKYSMLFWRNLMQSVIITGGASYSFRHIFPPPLEVRSLACGWIAHLQGHKNPQCSPNFM